MSECKSGQHQESSFFLRGGGDIKKFLTENVHSGYAFAFSSRCFLPSVHVFTDFYDEFTCCLCKIHVHGNKTE